MIADIATEKQLFRQGMLDLRAKISPQEKLASDTAITHQVLNSTFFAKAKTIFTYVSMDGEVDTRFIIEKGLNQGKRICVPRCASFGNMDAYEISRLDELLAGSYGILEPGESCSRIERPDIDLALVPCICATVHGERLGYGGGFYDRYLEHRTFPAIALCRDALLLNTLPTEKHDVGVDFVLTESATYTTL